MAISYANSPQAFVDSQFGTAATSTGIKVNVPVVVDKMYHKKVQTKTWWKQNGMIGDDAYSEGTSSATVAGFPVIRKTELNAAKGDTITMNQDSNLAITPNVGIVGGFQIVDAEVGWDTNYKKVKIEQWRQAVRTNAGMNEQRDPGSVPFVQKELDKLSDWSAQVEDSGLLYALHYGHAAHLLRMYGVTNLPISANTNTLIGNDLTYDTTRTIASLDGTNADNFNTKTLEIGATYFKENNFDLVSVGGESYPVVLVSPRAMSLLWQDSNFRNAVTYARERGIDNPLFKAPGAMLYRNCLIFEYDKIRSVIGSYNPAGLSVTNEGAVNSAIVEASYTGIGGGVAAANLTHTYFLGANAIALAEGRFKMAERTENDYGQIIGRAADNIWGASRMDWLNATGAAANNQSSLVIVNTIIQ